MLLRPALTAFGILLLAACSDEAGSQDGGESQAVSQAPAAETPATPAEPTPPAVPEPMPTEESPFTAAVAGRWAADPAWCTAEEGEGSAIEISEELFEGRENVCAIEELTEDGTAWVAALSCRSEGGTSREKIRMEPSGDTMTLTYLDRGVEGVKLNRCP